MKRGSKSRRNIGNNGINDTPRNNLSSIKKAVSSSFDKEDIVEFLFGWLSQKEEVTPGRIFSEINKIKVKRAKAGKPLGGVNLPVSIFDNKNLGALEAITKYMKETLGLNYHDASVLLNRDERSIWTTYQNSRKKMPQGISVKDTGVFVPTSALCDRRLGALESVVYYLKTEFGLNYHRIAVLMHRDDRTIWTSYSRARQKLKK